MLERTPPLTIVGAAQTHWRATARLMKNDKPHQSVELRKRKQRRRESGRETRGFFATAFDNMDAKPRREGELQKGKRTVAK